ncbi:MAG: hypothetical protein Q4G69_06080 [Planctomycetia bacterium]|nr:hypothetical protein [Planctomycetia bacterium]
MNNLKNLIILSLLILGTGWYFGSGYWKSAFKDPQTRNLAQKKQLQDQIAMGKQNLLAMNQFVNQNREMFTRSFPLNANSGKAEYQIWITQFAEFCDFSDTEISQGEYKQGSGMGILQFRLQAKCSMPRLYRFLYEFYWTPFLHRITMLDLQTSENTELLSLTMIIEGLVLARPNPGAAWPLADQLPNTTVPFRRLTSGPFDAYLPIAQKELFRYTPPGIDAASHVLLTGTPEVSDPDSGQKKLQSRWKVETENRTILCNIGDRLAIGSFDGTVEEIFEDLVILKQTSGYHWIVLLGDSLADAVAIPDLLLPKKKEEPKK